MIDSLKKKNCSYCKVYSNMNNEVIKATKILYEQSRTKNLKISSNTMIHHLEMSKKIMLLIANSEEYFGKTSASNYYPNH